MPYLPNGFAKFRLLGVWAVQVIGKREIIENLGILRVFGDMQEKEFFGEIETTDGRSCSIWIAQDSADGGKTVRRLMVIDTGNARLLMNETQADEFIRTFRAARYELAKMES